MVGDFLDTVVRHINHHYPVAGSCLDVYGVVADAETNHHLEPGTPLVDLVANRPEVGVEHCVGVVRQFDESRHALALTDYKLRADCLYCLALDLQIRQDIIRHHHLELSHLFPHLV